jgi:anhydro-N-acetylmuramic acid kinase
MQIRSQAGGCDLLRLALEYVVESIGRQVPPHVNKIICAGGGAANNFLMERLAQRVAPCTVVKSDTFRVPAKAREAMAFAILANDLVCGLSTSIPGVTGARGPRPLGKVSSP